jgi:S1-C subfamily serine protease
MAIGNPFGLEGSYSVGVISALAVHCRWNGSVSASIPFLM